MSVQLVLYPQDYQGYSYSTSYKYNEYVTDPTFNTVTNHTVTGGSQVNPSIALNCTNYNGSNWGTNVLANPIIGSSPYVVWVGYWSEAYCVPFAPTDPPIIDANGYLKLTSKDTSSLSQTETWCGVHTTVTNLTIGATYDLDITHNTPAIPSGSTRAFMIGALDVADSIGNGVRLTIPSPNSANTTYNFTATQTNMPLFITYVFDEDSDVRIQRVSIQEAPGTVDPTFSDLTDGQVIVDQYEEQDIPMTFSVDDFKNVIEKPQSYSKDFDLPNTKRNNKIFTHIFDVSKVIATTYDFNPYAKTRAVLKQDGLLIFDGYLKLLNIKDNNGEISYNVNLYSDVVSLADTLKERTFNNLYDTFAELTHEYNRTNIVASFATNGLVLSTALPANSFAGTGTNTDVLKYPFCNWIGEFVDATGANNNATVGYPELLQLEDAFRPFIKIKYLIDIIFDAAGYEYTSAFFDSADFGKLFMDFNWGSEENPGGYTNEATWNNWLNSANTSTPAAGTSLTNILFQPYTQAGQTLYYPIPPYYNGTTGVLTEDTDFMTWDVNYNIEITNTHSSSVTVIMQWLKNSTPIANSGIITVPASGTWTFTGSFNVLLGNGDTLTPQYSASVASVVNITDGTCNWARAIGGVNAGIILTANRGDINQFEFIQGIMKMFNLVAMPDTSNPQNILIEPYPDVFGDNPTAVTPTERDWTNKVDFSSIEYKPIDLKSKITLKYENDEADYNLRFYQSQTTVEYGSIEINGETMLGITGGKTGILEGEEEIIASPFAPTLIKPLTVNYSNFIVPQIFDYDENFKQINNLPRILYNNGAVTLNGGVTYYIPEQNTVGSANQPTFLQFTHLSAVQPTVSDDDYNFGQSQLVGLDPAPTNNLYNLYYSQYFSELYNPNTKVVTLKVNLNASDINTFRFYDKVRIKTQLYRVNRIDYKPNNLSTVELILIA